MVPSSVAALDQYLTSVRPELRCTPAAQESMAYLLDPPGLDEDIAEIWEDIRYGAVVSLPDWAREMYGYDAPPPLTPAAPGRDPAGARRARRRVPGRARRARGAAADRPAHARGAPRVNKKVAAGAVIGVAAVAVAAQLRRRRGPCRPRGDGAARPPRVLSARAGKPAVAAGTASLRIRRGLAALQLVARGGARYAASAPQLFAAAGEHRQQLRNDLALETAEDVATTLGAMKGVLMKLGQMASYIDDGLSPSVRRTLSRLQDSVPPMSPELAAGVVQEELGGPPEQVFARWDPEPIAAASIGQVHRAITLDGRAVAVKVQYPGIAETIAADLGNVALLRRMLRITAPSQDVDALLAELRERVLEELDYRQEAENQRSFAAYYDGHPTIRSPDHR